MGDDIMTVTVASLREFVSQRNNEELTAALETYIGGQQVAATATATANQSITSTTTTDGLRLNIKECTINFIAPGEETIIWDVGQAYPQHDPQVAQTLDGDITEKNIFLGGDLQIDAFVNCIKSYHPEVNEDWLQDAAENIKKIPRTIENSGEMILQQYLYAPFSSLFYSIFPKGYLADQMWNSPVQVIMDEGGMSKVAAKPDAASTFRHLSMPLPFLIGQLEIKPEDVNKPTSLYHVGDMGKSVLLTCCAALSMKKVKMTTGIAIPFLVAQNRSMVLCVTKLDENNKPVVNSVFQNPQLVDSNEGRIKTFLYLALLLAKQFKSCKDEITADNVVSLLQELGNASNIQQSESRAVKEVGDYTPTAKKKRMSVDNNINTSGGDNNNINTSGGTGGEEVASIPESKSSAKEAVAKSGDITDLQYPWPQRLQVNMDNIFEEPEVTEQTESPYYFRGRFAKDKQESLFCKVWREGDERTPPVETVKEEIRLLAIANTHGVPAPKIWIQHSATNVIVERNTFYVVVMSYIDGNAVLPTEIALYALSLVKAVRKLHRCGILHCDLKPPNICWTSLKQQVYVLDFGHAQPIGNARGYRTTLGFEAPEVIAGSPHSTASDAYGVGATILSELERLNVTESHWLRFLSCRLTAFESSGRITLDEAESMIERVLSSGSSESTFHEAKKPRFLVEATH